MEFSPYIAVFRYGRTPSSLGIFLIKKLILGDNTLMMTRKKL